MHRVILSLFGFFLSALIITVFSLPVTAQSTTGVTISPLRQEGSIAPGFVYTGTIMVKNDGDQQRQVSMSAESFNVTNQAYDYLFKADTPEVSWVSFDPASIVLKAGESRAVTYDVRVPIDTEPGGYYFALFTTNQSPLTTSGITPTERVASLLYLSVSGNALRSGRLVQLRSPVVIFNETTWSAALQNNGTLHYRSVYSSKISSVFNRQLSFLEDSRLILPGTVRLIEGSIQTPELLGLYQITYSVSLGDNPGHQETRWFLYLPPLQTILIVLIITGFIIIKKLYRRPV